MNLKLFFKKSSGCQGKIRLQGHSGGGQAESPVLPPAGGNVSPLVRVTPGAEKLKSTCSFFRGEVGSPVEGVFHLLLSLTMGQAPTPDGDIYTQVLFSRVPSSGGSWKSTWVIEQNDFRMHLR